MLVMMKSGYAVCLSPRLPGQSIMPQAKSNDEFIFFGDILAGQRPSANAVFNTEPEAIAMADSVDGILYSSENETHSC